MATCFFYLCKDAGHICVVKMVEDETLIKETLFYAKKPNTLRYLMLIIAL